MAYVETWDKTDPVDHTKFIEQPGFVRELKRIVEERVTDYLYGFASGETDSALNGFKYIPIRQQASSPTHAADTLFLLGKEISSVLELIVVDESGNDIQLTKNQKPISEFTTALKTTQGLEVDSTAVISGTGEIGGKLTAKADLEVEGTLIGAFQYDGTKVYDATPVATATWYELDLSAYVGSRRALVYLGCETGEEDETVYMYFRPHGATNTLTSNDTLTVSNVGGTKTNIGHGWFLTDSAGKIDFNQHHASPGVTSPANIEIHLKAYIV